MKLAYTAYKFLSHLLFPAFFPFYTIYAALNGRPGLRTRQRLGLYPASLGRPPGDRARIWLHAASVGEVGAAAAVIEALAAARPDCEFILSTATVSGQDVASDKLPKKVTRIYAPFDFVPAVRRALSLVKPDILVLVETEIWPNWLTESRRRGVSTALVNGRISKRSIRRYLRIRPLMQAVLAHIQTFSMISSADAERIRSIGAEQDRIRVAGNAKYDRLLKQAHKEQAAATAERFRLSGTEPVWVAGSTRGREGEIVLNIYEKLLPDFPNALLVIAPRHIERVREIQSMAAQKGLRCQLRTELEKPGAVRTAPVVILDTIGELQSVYSIAKVVFCGGSLVPMGGQNMLEAAVWGKPILYGPSMEDFQDAKELLDKTGGGIQVAGESELASEVIRFFKYPGEAERVGRQARQALLFHQGAARKHAEAIAGLLSDRMG